MAKLNIIQKEEIIKLLKENYKTRNIAERFNVSQHAILDVKNNYFKYGSASLVVKGVGRKKLADKSSEELEIIALKNKVKELELELDFAKKFKAFILNQK